MPWLHCVLGGVIGFLPCGCFPLTSLFFAVFMVSRLLGVLRAPTAFTGVSGGVVILSGFAGVSRLGCHPWGCFSCLPPCPPQWFPPASSIANIHWYMGCVGCIRKFPFSRSCRPCRSWSMAVGLMFTVRRFLPVSCIRRWC